MFKKIRRKIADKKKVPLYKQMQSGIITKEEAMYELGYSYENALDTYHGMSKIVQKEVTRYNNDADNTRKRIEDYLNGIETPLTIKLLKLSKDHIKSSAKIIEDRNTLFFVSFEWVMNEMEGCAFHFPEYKNYFTLEECVKYYKENDSLQERMKKITKDYESIVLDMPTDEEIEEFNKVATIVYEKKCGRLKGKGCKIFNENNLIYNEDETALMEYDYFKDFINIDYKGIV